jgi:ribonuclease Z
MGNAERTEPLTIVGPPGVERVVNSLRVIAPELPFPIRFVELHEKEEVMELVGLKITAFKVNHNITCYGYSMSLKRQGKFDVEAATAAGIDRRFWNSLQKGETVTADDGRVLTPDMVLGAERKGIKLTYCTDTRPTDSIVRNAADSDLFICEGMYGEKDKQQKARENKHMTFYEAARLARDAKVKEMWLTHYSPSLVNPKEFMPETKSIFANSIAAKDGRNVELRFED